MSLQVQGHSVFLKLEWDKIYNSFTDYFTLGFYNMFDIYKCSIPDSWMLINLLHERENSTTGNGKGKILNM